MEAEIITRPRKLARGVAFFDLIATCLATPFLFTNLTDSFNLLTNAEHIWIFVYTIISALAVVLRIFAVIKLFYATQIGQTARAAARFARIWRNITLFFTASTGILGVDIIYPHLRQKSPLVINIFLRIAMLAIVQQFIKILDLLAAREFPLGLELPIALAGQSTQNEMQLAIYNDAAAMANRNLSSAENHLKTTLDEDLPTYENAISNTNTPTGIEPSQSTQELDSEELPKYEDLENDNVKIESESRKPQNSEK